ncbi:BatA and WFA domain-containing protein [Heyndrickxia oleronia]|uniref:VWFA domain-containing protein n=1 Tax=Heyndrickxia oleronia TaxID=38875 RepID=A0A8E2I4W9_9BACI|nr:BatA and WFA domain-containing protein [Heyndrickxia oleronia]MEC1372788.1 BatA and WFA domain-containing protein [Heyndrickxia oleronia]OJH17885.1 hypothetical protein BLX88_15265 [Bacillus obstructivus]OOP66764.1 hypothetical protein BWZ43_19285 [Heyndrickxia oleronia]QQZ03387.1 VWA domain-containing protein [Heyndrickxia oleronia]
MGVTNPIYFLLTIFIAGVIIFYLFRKQYEKKIIPSNLFWDQVMNEWQASPWIEKLQKNLLLWLQLAILTLLMFALINPFWLKKGIEGEHFIFIIDTSASMSARNGVETRFQLAKKEISNLVNQLNGQDVTLITIGNEAKIELKNETNFNLIQSKIKELSLSYQTSNMNKAVLLADSLTGKDHTSIHIFSDAVTKDTVPKMKNKIPLHVHNVGKNGDNLSLLSFGVTKKKEKIIGAGVIKNQSNREQKVEFFIQNNDDTLFSKKLIIPANGQKIIEVPDLVVKDYYTAKIVANDIYPIDNTRTAVYSKSLSKLYAVGEVNQFVIKGFQTIGIPVTQISEKDWNEESSDGIILMEGRSSETWPRSPLIIFNPQKGKEIALKRSISVIDDPLLQYVEFDQTYIQKGTKTNHPYLETLARSGDLPLLEKGEYMGNRVVSIDFAIEDSDWPLKPGFPIFLYQSFQWLSEQQHFKGFFLPGEKKWMSTSGNSDWKVFDESGKFLSSYQLDKESFVAPKKPGLYQIIAGDQSMYISVVLDEEEQSVQVEPSFVMNQPKDQVSQSTKATKYSFLWFWLTVAAFIILLIEWEVYSRAHRR